MNEETKKYLCKVIDRQEEILNGPPWHARDSLRAFQKKLKEATEKPSEENSTEPMGE